MSDAAQAVYSVAGELGINLDSTEESPSAEAQTESTDAEGAATNEELASEIETEDAQDADQPVPEEDAAANPETNKVAEEPKLTLKEFQELTVKQQELEAKEKAFTERMQAQEKEFQEKYHEKVKTHDQIDDFFAHLANKDPDLFEILKGEFYEHQKQYSNPLFQALNDKVSSLEKELGSFKNNASDEVTLTKLDSAFKDFMQTTGKDAEAAGLKIDRKEIENLWVKGLTVPEAFYAKYGEAYAKASASKAKLATVTKKTEARPTVPTAGSVSKTNTPGKSEVPKDAFDAVSYFAKKLTGKTY